jgi:hypothetical protein
VKRRKVFVSSRRRASLSCSLDLSEHRGDGMRIVRNVR